MRVRAGDQTMSCHLIYCSVLFKDPPQWERSKCIARDEMIINPIYKSLLVVA